VIERCTERDGETSLEGNMIINTNWGS